MAANEKKSSPKGRVVLFLTVVPLLALFLDLWDTTSCTTLEYIFNALDKPAYVVSVCLILMGAAAILGPIFALLSFKDPKAMSAVATVSCVGILCEVTYFAVYSAPFGEMVEWMGPAAFVYFVGAFAAFCVSLTAAIGKKEEPAPVKKPVMPMPKTDFSEKPREEAPKKPEQSAPARPQEPAPAPVQQPVPPVQQPVPPVQQPVPPVQQPAPPAPPAPPVQPKPAFTEPPAPPVQKAPMAPPPVFTAPPAPPAPVFREAPPAPAAEPVCAFCGGKLAPGMRFCPGCGKPTEAKPVSQPLPVAPPPPVSPTERVYCPTCRIELAAGTRQCRFCGNTVHAVAVPGATAAQAPAEPAVKSDRNAVCPHCGAKQLPAPSCKYCGTPMN